MLCRQIMDGKGLLIVQSEIVLPEFMECIAGLEALCSVPHPVMVVQNPAENEVFLLCLDHPDATERPIFPGDTKLLTFGGIDSDIPLMLLEEASFDVGLVMMQLSALRDTLSEQLSGAGPMAGTYHKEDIARFDAAIHILSLMPENGA